MGRRTPRRRQNRQENEMTADFGGPALRRLLQDTAHAFDGVTGAGAGSLTPRPPSSALTDSAAGPTAFKWHRRAPQIHTAHRYEGRSQRKGAQLGVGQAWRLAGTKARKTGLYPGWIARGVDAPR